MRIPGEPDKFLVKGRGYKMDALPAMRPEEMILCDLDGNDGFGLESVNVVERTRWNTAFAYLDPVRDRPNLRIVDNALVDRIAAGDARDTLLLDVRETAETAMGGSPARSLSRSACSSTVSGRADRRAQVAMIRRKAGL